jgi:hypothetical protein
MLTQGVTAPRDGDGDRRPRRNRGGVPPMRDIAGAPHGGRVELLLVPPLSGVTDVRPQPAR